MKEILLALIIIANIQSVIAQSTKEFIVENLESNQPYPDKGVAFFDNDFVVFSGQIENSIGEHSRRRKRDLNKKVKLLPQNLDFYFTPIDDNGNFINSQKLNNVINSKYDDYGLTFSKDQSIVYFSREVVMKNSKGTHLEIFRAKVISPGSWMNIKKISISNPDYSVGYPCLSPDGKTLYYVANNEGDFNIYKVAVGDDGVIGQPIKLSSNINSSSNETTPFLFNNKLFFSSDRPGGLGGFDIYFVDLNDKNSKILRIEAPINSEFDDINFIKKNSNQGFFVSNRPGGKGKEDIYFFKAKNDISAVNNKIIFDEEEEVLAKNKQKIANKKLSNSNETSLRESNDSVIQKRVVKTDSIVLVKNENVYDFQRRNSYDRQVLSGTKVIEVKDGGVKDEYSKCQIEFDKINNVYFDYSESYIRADAAIELDKVIHVLRLCPKIVLQASSHTDSRASNAYNLKLSQARANNVVKYILKNGHFLPNRIVSRGYGEERLVNGCSDGVKCTESEHQLNRRTHFEIFNY